MNESTTRDSEQIRPPGHEGVDEALLAWEVRRRRLFEAAKDGILILDAGTGKVIDVNPLLTELTGYSKEDLLGRHLWETDLFKAVASKASFGELQSKEYARYDEVPLEAKDGRKIYAEFTSNAYCIANRILCVIRDITSRKQVEYALQASETRYRRLFEAAKDGILILDANTGKIVDANPFLTELTGYSHDDLLSKHLWEIGLFKDVAASKVSFVELQAKEYVRYDNLPLETRDGREIGVEFVSSVYRIGNQKIIQCNIRDITRTETELLFRNLILSTQQETFIDGVLVVDANGRIVSSNRRFVDMWSVPPDIMESKSAERALQWVMDQIKNSEEFIRTMKFLKTAPDERSHDEIALKDGRMFDRYSAPMLGPDQRSFGRVWYFRDITERKQAEGKREKLEEQLRASQKMEAIGSLAGGVAHDFNNLLSVILSYTVFAMKGVREGDPIRDDLLEVKKAGERAAALTRQLLAFGRKQVLQPVPLDLNQIATGVEKMLRRILGEDIDLVQTLSPGIGLTFADPGQIEQVLMNLVVNARDAMPEGGQLTIETSNVQIDEEYAASHVGVTPGSYVQMAVTDTGCGMDSQIKDRLFEPFFTTKQEGKGTGLGLSTAYGIVRQSGGNISVYSEVGQGTTFKILLPRDHSATTVTASKPSVARKRATGSETILVVEDEEALRRVARRALVEAGYTVLTAADGDEALLICAQHSGDIQLLLTDVVMPRMSGEVLAQTLSKTRPALKVLHMSGYTDKAIVHHGVLDAGTHFLAKPFTSVDLTRKVREVLDEGTTGVSGEDELTQKAGAATAVQPLGKDALGVLSPVVLGQLRRAVTAARYDDLVELIDAVGTTAPEAAAGLRQMAGVFDYDGLHNLLGPRKE